MTSSARSFVASARPKPPVPPVIEGDGAGQWEVGHRPIMQERRKRSSTRMPNCSDSTGTRSSMPWNSDGEVQVRRQPQRREAEAAHAEPLEALGVGAAAHREGHRARAVVLGLERGDHLVDQRAVERRLHGLVVDEPLALDALADQAGQLALELLLLAVEEAAVDGRAGRAGDDVGLVAGVEHRRVGRVAQGRADHPADAAEPGQRLLGLVGVDLDAVGVADRVEELRASAG